ncbi:MAG: glycerophosphodiester phosphodiesterase family protein [Bacillota bacterium]
MKKRLGAFKNILLHNIKTLLIFEGLYRILGILLIFPLASMLMSWSISLAGFTYITNARIMDYITAPTTGFVIFLIGIVLGLYIAMEIIILSVLYRFSKAKMTIGIFPLLRLGVERIRDVLLSRNILIIIPAGLFFLFVELMQFVGVLSTITIPSHMLEAIEEVRRWRFMFYGTMLVGFVFFFETMMLPSVFTLHNKTLKGSWRLKQRLMKGKRLKMLLEFFVLNAILNLILFSIYFLLVAFVGFLISLIRGQTIALGLTLTVIYALYSFVISLISFTLIPINYALISTWHHASEVVEDESTKRVETLDVKPRLPLTKKRVRRLVIIIIMGLIAINFTNVFTVLQRSSNQTEFFTYPEIVAHRGASEDAPENTLSAVELALEQEADAIEIDVRMTDDGTVILMHDATLGRTTNDSQNRYVRDVTYDEIRQLDAGSWFSSEYEGEPVPTLEEVLEVVGRRSNLFIEMKDKSGAMNERVVELIEEYNVENTASILSDSESQLHEIKTLNEDIETIMLISTFYGNINNLINDDSIDHFALGFSFYINNDQYVTRMHDSDRKVYAWTVNTEGTIASLSRRNVDGLITDRPIYTREQAYLKNASDFTTTVLELLFPNE